MDAVSTPNLESIARCLTNALQAEEHGHNGRAFEAFPLNNDRDVIILAGSSTMANSVVIDFETTRALGSRVFVIGVGTSCPADSQLYDLTRTTGGAWISLYPGEPMESAISRLLELLRAPRISELSVVWPDADVPISHLTISQIAVDRIQVHALLEKKPCGKLRLAGMRWPGTGTLEELDCESFMAKPEDGETLPRIVAALRMQSLESLDITKYKKNLAEVAQIAVDYQLLSHQTNFLLVDSRNDREETSEITMPLLHQVKQMLPAGWSATGTVIRGDPDLMRLDLRISLGMAPRGNLYR